MPTSSVDGSVAFRLVRNCSENKLPDRDQKLEFGEQYTIIFVLKKLEFDPIRQYSLDTFYVGKVQPLWDILEKNDDNVQDDQNRK